MRPGEFIILAGGEMQESYLKLPKQVASSESMGNF